ncbi:TetR family transcriptional regulator [Parafrankia colletiae]|uniref:TetR family transcriptional regulator n=1 Tax=Parafrankia colletiae TaxID=573497 RepID=A0A1S1Q2J4_9ACTN|nr:TetR/AcrR family transcriptional regulator [Parafrankia colletiae]MCK9901761.1 TetR/AcrR family transcriptional regulator [Frankia sp. Cpl3]OHV27816.1 TetR family transcriptional regulator [Parafrankia colletiae]
MSTPATSDGEGGQPRQRRRYDSPVCRERAGQTRERIVAAGSALVHEFPIWDWSGLAFRAGAERAGVGERTVYRHFPTERDLHAAVMRRLQTEAGVGYDDLDLDAVAPHSTGWTEHERRATAAVLDVLWSLPGYERLVRGWQLDPDTAAQAVSWVMGLVVEAIRDGQRPGDPRRPTA